VAKEIKIATFNVEWMVDLFTPSRPPLLTRPNPKTPGLGQKPKDPQGVANRIAAVIERVDPDILGICEGPPLRSQLAWFVKHKLDDAYGVHSMEDGTQSVHALVHKRLGSALRVSQLPASDGVFTRMRAVRPFYRFGSVDKAEKGRFARLPVILRLERRGKITELMVVHTKSKFSSLNKPSQWERKDRDKVIDAILVRQKLSLEMNVIRKYIAHRLYSRSAEGVIVMGDMNDGVTRDIVDESYLLHSIVHELRGAFHHELALMRHVLTGRQLQRKGYAWTVEFADPAAGGKATRVLLDHMIFSPACLEGGAICFVPESGRVEHPAYDRQEVHRGKTRDDRPSDHRPLSARFELR
jgi:hypothetical protein